MAKNQKKSKDNIESLISELLRTPIQPSPFTFFSQSSRRNSIVEPSTSLPETLPNTPNNTQLPPNTLAQKQLNTIIQKTKVEIYEYTRLSQVAMSPELCSKFFLKPIVTLKNLITSCDTKKH